MFPIGAFFIGVGTVAAIAAVLALVMAVADATIANYGEVKISINDGAKELTVDGGRPLLSTLTAEGIFIPSACGGRGSCGLCKLAVKSGAGEYAPTELPWITEADRKNQRAPVLPGEGQAGHRDRRCPRSCSASRSTRPRWPRSAT